jgi:phosphoribosyl-ATP pyrophosphohydrolase/phosphoribosyl-AMP cyclohydrolase
MTPVSNSTNSQIQRPTQDPDFEKGGGLITVVAQDAVTGAILMVAHMDREAYEKTIETGEMHYRSRTRGLWHKGGTSGNVQRVQALLLDCDCDTLLARVIPAGPACHTGSTTCFGPESIATDVIGHLDGVIADRARQLTESSVTSSEERPSYTKKLLTDRNLRLKKLGEEITELVVALCDNDKSRAAEESADVLYHMLVALQAEGIHLKDIQLALSNRVR